VAKYKGDFDDVMEWEGSQEERDRVGRFEEWQMFRWCPR